MFERRTDCNQLRSRDWFTFKPLLRQLDLEKQPDSQWPDVRDAALLATLENWLMPYLGKVSRLSHFGNLGLSSILHNVLPWPLPQRLDELAPHHLNVPSGSSVRLHYSEHPPILAVRLQELFGLADTSRIAGGRQIIKLHLLSPARASDAGLSQLLAQHLCRGEEGFEGAVSVITGQMIRWWQSRPRGLSRVSDARSDAPVGPNSFGKAPCQAQAMDNMKPIPDKFGLTVKLIFSVGPNSYREGHDAVLPDAPQTLKRCTMTLRPAARRDSSLLACSVWRVP